MKILNFGSLNIDKVYKVKHFVRPGETIFSEEYQCFPGGKGLNQSIAAARAGVPIYHAGTIGPDGRFLAELLKESGVDTRYLRENGSITGHALIQVSEEGENCIILFNGSNYENGREFINQVLEDFGEGDILVLQNEISNLPYLLEKGAAMGGSSGEISSNEGNPYIGPEGRCLQKRGGMCISALFSSECCGYYSSRRYLHRIFYRGYSGREDHAGGAASCCLRFFHYRIPGRRSCFHP